MQRRLVLRVTTSIVTVALAAAAQLGPRPAMAGSISPDLSTQLRSASPDAPLRALVFLRQQAPMQKLRAAQKARGAGRGERHREVIESLQSAAASQGALLGELHAKGAAGGFVRAVPYWISNVVVLEATPALITQVAARADVDWIEPVRHPMLIAPVARPDPRWVDPTHAPAVPNPPDGIRAIRAPEVWHRLGYNGAGTLVANLDTGVNGDHQALRERWRGARPGADWRTAWFDPADSTHTFPTDSNSHGTHVMGTMTGLGTTTNDTTGVAWGAEWIACNGIMADTAQGGGDPIIAAFQWFADPDGNPETDDDVPDVVQNSWGWSMTEPGYSPCDSHWWSVIDHCEAAGVVVTWSAGNDGPEASTMLIPADRADSPTNVFSIGAVMATGTSFPYSVAPFSSRGPTYCTRDPLLMTKPEVVAPGVNVYSTVPGGFQGGWSGTSMAGPHVAGIVALLRQANPDLDVDAIKVVLMETARDLGRTGEDNESGWGFVDAYAAVLRAITSFGQIEGTVRNGSTDGSPVPRARVTLLDSSYRFHGNGQGRYRGSATAATYRAVAEADGFAPDSADIAVTPREVSSHDFLLRDDTPPSIAPAFAAGTTTDSVGPYVFRFLSTDPSGLRSAQFRYRKGDAPWAEAPATITATQIDAKLPGSSPGTLYEYYLRVEDRAGLSATWPNSGEAAPARFEIRRLLHQEDFESHPAPGWTAGIAEDTATSGLWVQADPIGTFDHGRAMQPEEDHTAGEGTLCFITGNGTPGGGAGDADVDGGCTTLLSPVIDLSREREVFASWWYWLGMGGASADDSLFFDLSTDGGESWRRLDVKSEADTVWQFATYRLDEATPITNRMRFRFQPCDRGLPGVLEAGLDDLSIEALLAPTPLPPPPPTVARLYPAAPNPCRGSCRISFDQPAVGTASVTIWDALGRRVRRLYGGPTDIGTHDVPWDGRDDAGRRVPTGVYFCRLDGPGVRARQALLFFR